ncbi:hypothetical protein [Pseudomonas turukhanskensis]|uniref:3-isopropylmalate dehydratase n=1 Tax=Pseudomonas turukhanskensis TaxID=1806536 RepID=A0A9W6NHM7_9PSED|nr:hypothetical protein [Pseudomonas turukhanskensis]GLK92019.1 hypothetical protein GCM10017655_50830 [Pseudomonas turukhanskensis]
MRAFLFAGLMLTAVIAHAEFAEAPTPQSDGYGVLIISRERLEVGSPCDIGLYLQDQLAARLWQGQSVAFNLPPGAISVRLGLLGPGVCSPGISQTTSISVDLIPGEIRRYRIGLNTTGLYLLQAPPLNQ